MAKIVRFLLILTTIFTLSFYLPSLYRRTVEERPLKTMIYFSEVSHDFVIAREGVDSSTQEAAMLYYDTRGNVLTETQYMQLLPFNNRRKLKLMGFMPDSLDGVALTTDVLRNVKRSMLVADRSFSYGLAPLFESAPERVGVSLPDDLFRIGKRGIEFIDCTTGEVLREKSARFAQAMQAAGFEAPARDIYGIPSVIKRWDSGYFITDRNGRLFHLMMVKGAPYCRKIETDFEIKNIKCHTDEEIFCHIFDTDNRLYVLTTDYRLLPLPVEIPSGRCFMTSNDFFRTYKTTEKDTSILFALDPSFGFVARHAEKIDHYNDTPEAEWERRLFPFSTMKTPGYAHFIPIPNPVRDFWVVNLVCLVVWVALKLYKRRSLQRPENIGDAIVILLTGIYGLITVLMFPNRK